jgi:hypothetical protein
MYASGSTWLFNAARAVAATLYPDLHIAGHFADEARRPRPLPRALNVVKTHDLPFASARFMGAQADVILISLRDPRDAVTSMMQHMRLDFAPALRRAATSGQFAAGFHADARSSLYIYESGFTDTAETFDSLATALGGELTDAQRAALFTATRRSKIEEKISRLADLPTAWRNPADGDLLDRDTQWHRHHAGRDGESGRWRRMLQVPEVAQIEQKMAGFMRSFGYLGE